MEQPRCYLVWLVASVLLAAACGKSVPEPERPNLLLIAIDTLRVDHLGSYGYEVETSPRIDALLEESVVFEDAHATSSWTLSSFASLMTGLYPSTHKCVGFRSRLDRSYTTLAEILRDHGYATAGIVSHVFMSEKYGLQQGFAHYDQALVLSSAGRSHKQISSPSLSTRALDWLRVRSATTGDQPWFLFVHYFDPHAVYNPHEGFEGRFGSTDVARYDGEIAFTDHHVGRLLDGLDELGFSENTVVALVSDHGEEFLDHGMLRHGKTLYREVMQIPFSIRAPGVTPRRVRDTVRIVDVSPTVLDLLRVPRPTTPIAGRSLAPLLRGESIEPRGALAELRLREAYAADAYVLGRWKLIADRDGDGPSGSGGAGTFLLFDREADPTEQHDVASSHPEVVGELTRHLERALQEARDLAAAYGESERLTLSGEELEQLRALGYAR